MKHSATSPISRRATITLQSEDFAMMTSGIGGWHPGKLALLWLPSLALAAWYETVLLGVLGLVGSAVATWKWLSVREIKEQRRPVNVSTEQAELIECMVWCVIARIRIFRSRLPRPSRDAEQSIDLVMREAFAGSCVAARYALDLVVREDPALRQLLFSAFTMRLSRLVYLGELSTVVKLVMARDASFHRHFHNDDIDALLQRATAAWYEALPTLHADVRAPLAVLFAESVTELIRGPLRPFAPPDEARVLSVTKLESPPSYEAY